MNKFITLLMTVCVSVISLSAAPKLTVIPLGVDNAPGKQQVKVNKADLIVDENFEYFTSGSELSPAWNDEDYLCSYETDINIDPNLTHGNQFTGHNVAMAGGMAAIHNSETENIAFIATPKMDYSGSIELSFKAKALRTEIIDPDGTTSYLTGSSLQIGIGSNEEYLNIDGKYNSTLANFSLYEHQGWCLVSIKFNNYTAANDARIIISSTGHLLLDDLQVTASIDEFIAEPICKGITNATNNSFTISWSPVRKSFNYYLYLYEFKGYDSTGQPIYQTVVNINNLYISDETKALLEAQGMTLREYLESNAEAAGKSYDDYLQDFVYNKPYNNYEEIKHVPGQKIYSYTFDDLDPDKEYYYDLRSHYMHTFSDENIRMAEYIGSPVNLNATDITSNSFKAHWTKINKADGYLINLYGAEIAADDEEDYIIFEESFDATEYLTDATDISNPEEPSIESSMTLDDLTSSPGWTFPADKILLVKGKVGLNVDNIAAPYLLTSPLIYTANSDEATIYLKIESELTDFDIYLCFADQWYSVSAQGNSIEGFLTLPTFGFAETQISMFGPYEAPIFIDYIEVTCTSLKK